MQPRHAAEHGLGRQGFGSDRLPTVFVLSLSRTTQVDRDPDWVFHQLHDPEIQLGCVPGGSLTKVIDAARFEGRIVIGAGPFKFSYYGDGRIIDSDAKARTASLRLHAHPLEHVPDVRILMSMAVDGHPRGSQIQMSFSVTVIDCSRLLNRSWIDPIASDLLDRTVRRIKRQLEATTGLGPA